MPGRITAATLILVLAAGCSTGSVLFGGSSNSLSYAQYHSVQEGMEAREIMKAFGAPADVLEKNGVVRGLTYACQDSTGRVQQFRMAFDAQGRLTQWALQTQSGAPIDVSPASPGKPAEKKAPEAAGKAP